MPAIPPPTGNSERNIFPRPDRATLLFGAGAVLITLLAIWFRLAMADLYLREEGIWEADKRLQTAAASARAILEGSGFGEVFSESDRGVDDSGLGLVMAAVWLLTGDRSIESFHRFLLFLDALAVLAMMLIAARVFGRAASLLCGLLLCFYIPGIYDAIQADVYVYVHYFAVAVMALTLWFPKRPAPQALFAVGIGGLTVMASMVRSTFLAFALVPAFYLLLRHWKSRGLLVAAVILAISLAGSLTVKLVLRNPTHQLWHAIFVGLGEFPNRMGMKDVDTAGFEAAWEATGQETKYDPLYLDTLRHRALLLIDENPRQYVGLVMRRLAKVLYAPQDWGFYWVRIPVEQQTLLSWTIFLLSLAGMVLAFLEKRHESLILLLTFLYFSLSLVPILATHGHYFLVSSVIHVSFASFALSRLRFLILRSAGLSTPQMSPPKSEWGVSPFTRGFFLTAMVVSLFLGLTCLGGFITYASFASRQWRGAFLDEMNSHPTVAALGPVDSSTLLPGKINPLHSFSPSRLGVPHVIRIDTTVRRGRIAFQVRNNQGEELSSIAHTSGIGTNHTFLSFVPDTTNEAVLHGWVDPPYELGPKADAFRAACIQLAWSHYGIRDHTKLDWFPHLEIEASEAIPQEGVKRIPLWLDKDHRTVHGQPLLPVWRAKPPCWLRIGLPHAPLLSTLIVRQTTRPPYPFTVLVRKKGEMLDKEVSPKVQEDNPSTGEARMYFEPAEIEGIELRFADERNGPFLDLQDVSAPDPALFEVASIQVHGVEKVGPETRVPKAFSFLSP